ICEIMVDGSRCIILSRPEYIEKLMSTCARRLPYYQGLDEFGFSKHGIAGNDVYEIWRFNRQFFDHVLMSPRFRDYTVKSINKLFEELRWCWQSLGMQNVPNKNDNNNWTLETDFAKWFHAFANEIISVIVTSERTYSIASYYNMQSAVKHEYSDASDWIEKIEAMPVGTEMRSDMLTSLITLNTEKDTDTAKIKTVDGMTYKPMPDEEIRSNLLEAFGGGSDSTANTFCSITYYVCKHLNVKQKMISEIDSVFSKYSNLSYLTRDDLLKLKYCKAIINEALRMIPVTNIITRHMTEECEIAGYKWASGTLFHINISGLHSHPEVWPNPEVFDPDRFYNIDQDDKRLKDKYSLVTFGGGLRICPGRKLAMTQLLLWMSLVYRYYNV
ncbi:21604_t:CDS:2, partial [Cetraspora pellucida]